MLKFVHCADIHLDSPLRGLSRYPGAPVELLQAATRDAFSNLVDFCIADGVNLLVIAGDLYDGDWKDFNTGIFFSAEMGRLRQEGIHVVVLHGNHDAESQITKSLTLPDNVHVFPTRKPHTIGLENLGVALHGQSFKRRDVTDNLVTKYPEPLAGMLNIGVLHTALEGYTEHAEYAPCSLDQLKNKGYQYWALGHIHQSQILHDCPYIVFPGNLQGRHIREKGPKGAVIVTADEGEILKVEHEFTDVLRWEHLHVDVTTARSDSEVIELVRGAIEQAVETKADGRVLAMRLTVLGKTAAHGMLLRKEDQFRADIRSLTAGLGSDVAWLEKIKVETEPEISAEVLREREDALGELQLMLDAAAEDEALVTDLENELGGLLASSHPEACKWLKIRE